MSLNVFADYIENCKEYGKEPSWEGLRTYKTMYSKSKKQVHPYITNKKVVDGIIENEIEHIQDFLESDFTKKNEDYVQASLITELMYKELLKSATEHQRKLLDEFYSAFMNEQAEMHKFYFRQGLNAGLGKLKFLNEIDNVEHMI